jgi:hypothetical protein
MSSRNSKKRQSCSIASARANISAGVAPCREAQTFGTRSRCTAGAIGSATGAEATKAGFAGAATTEVETLEVETPEAGIAEGRITRAGTAEVAAAGTFTARTGLAAGLVWTRLAEARAAGTGLAATRLAEARVAETRLVREAIERAAFGMTFNCRMLSRLLQGCNKPKYASGARERDKLNAVSVETGQDPERLACFTNKKRRGWGFKTE